VTYAEGEESLPTIRSNSAQRLRSLHGALTVPQQLAKAVTELPGPLLLLDDFTETGWTLAVAAPLL
jgi:ATP-dependent DNA helicase RecQ